MNSALTWGDVYAALSPEDRAAVDRYIRENGLQGLGSWLSSIVRRVAQPVAAVAATVIPGAGVVSQVLNTAFPVAQNAPTAPPPPAEKKTDYTPLLIGSGVLLLAVLLLKR